MLGRCAAMGLAAAFGVAAATVGAGSVAAAAETTRYRVTVRLDWRVAPDALDRPTNPHFSPLIGATHGDRFRLFVDGDTASSGVALVATNGRTSVLQAELNEAQRRGRIGAVVEAPGLASGAGETAFTVIDGEDHPLVSFALMLAPSPDWFTGVSGVALPRDDAWMSRVEVPLWVWDADVDDGARFDAPNEPVQPQRSVRLAAGPQFLLESGLTPIGHAVLEAIADQESGVAH